MSPQHLSALERLPNEILLLIHDVLDDVSAVCLQHTNSNLKAKLNRDPTSFSRCTKWLIMCRFEEDIPPTHPVGRYPKDRFTCAFCKAKRTRPQMEGRRGGRSGISFPICDPWRVFQPPEAKYCAKHPLFITWVKPSPVEPEATKWVMTPRLTCMHCAAHVQSADTRSTGCANCECDVCPRVPKPLFIRYGKLPKAARGGRPYIDGLITLHGRRTNYVSEVGKFSTTRAEFVGGPGSHQYLTRGVPEYAGNLTDVSPWEWKDKKRAKIYTALKCFIANCVSPFY